MFTFNFSWNDDLDFEDQCIHYENQWAKLFKSRPYLEDVDCIVIRTGYTDRIIESRSLLAKLNPAVVVTDKVWAPTLAPYVKNRLLHKISNITNFEDGYVVMNERSGKKALELIEKLGRLDYCGCCDVTNVHTATWYTSDNDIVVLGLEVDCESG